MELYHVTMRSFATNSILSIDSIENFHNREIQDYFTKDEYNNIINATYKNGLSKHGQLYNLPYYKFGQNYFIDNNIPLELIFELVRKQNFPDKLSRFESIFACESLEDAKLFINKYRDNRFKVYKIECQNYLKVDMSLLSIGQRPIDIIVLANKYWQGQSSGNPFWEYMVELPVTIIEECK